jgi:uncharacterized protein (TIGR02646 family)
MRHIDKTGEKSLEGKAIIDNWVVRNQTRIANLSEQEDPQSDQLWKIFRKKKNEIRSYLFEEQGGLCCYCGCELTRMKHYIVIEHFKLKSEKRNYQYPNIFDYANLLLSCHGNKFKIYEVKNGDTWAEIATNICTFGKNELNQLREMNPDIDLVEGEPKEGERLIVGFISGDNNHHCDNYRGEKELPINPIELPNCIDRFVYTVKEEGKEGHIKAAKVDYNEAILTIQNLNLQSEILIRKREQRVEDVRNLLDDISKLGLENRDEIVNAIRFYLSKVKGFYVVYRAYFKDSIPELFVD